MQLCDEQKKETRFPVFHVPHDGWRFPPELMADVCVPEEDFLAYHEMMRDRAAGRLVPRLRAAHAVVRFGVSRLLCDVERFIGPEEIMERYGMGYCYEKAYDGRIIKHVTDRTLAAARRYYDAHHRAVDRLCEEHPRIVFLDMHSYLDEILPPFARVPGAVTPDLCIGTDPRFTPPGLLGAVRCRFEAAGFSTAADRPYSGLYVPESVLSGSSSCDFVGVMLEFHRRAYCRETGEPDPERLRLIRRAIRQILADCADADRPI